MSIRILHVLGTAQPESTGILRMVKAAAQALPRERYQQAAWFLLGDGPLAEEMRAAGFDVRIVPWTPSPRDPLGALRFWRALRRERCDIIHQHFGGPHLRRVARSASDAKILVHLWARTAETANPVPVPLSTRGADRTVACSRAVADFASPGPAEVIYPGIELFAGAHPASSTGEVVIGTATRLIALKRVDLLIRAVAQLADLPALRLEIAGDGPEMAALVAQAHSLGVADRVTFLGWRADVRSVMSHWHVYVHASAEESLCVSILEAMAEQLPVIATAVGGIPEIVDDGRTAFLVPAGDVDALAGRIRDLATDPELRLRMGAAGRRRVVERHLPERAAEQLDRVYRQMLGKSAAAQQELAAREV